MLQQNQELILVNQTWNPIRNVYTVSSYKKTKQSTSEYHSLCTPGNNPHVEYIRTNVWLQIIVERWGGGNLRNLKKVMCLAFTTKVQQFKWYHIKLHSRTKSEEMHQKQFLYSSVFTAAISRK